MASARNTDKNRIRRRRLGRLEEIDALELPDLDDVDLDDGEPEGTFPDGEPSGGETSDGEGGAASAAAPSGESAEDRQAGTVPKLMLWAPAQTEWGCIGLDIGSVTVDEVCRLMSQNPSWADGLPLAAGGDLAPAYYFKD